jgi:hypothetical protein
VTGTGAGSGRSVVAGSAFAVDEYGSGCGTLPASAPEQTRNPSAATITTIREREVTGIAATPDPAAVPGRS